MSGAAVRTAVAVVLSGAVLVGCGTQERPDADDWGPIGPVETSPSGGTEPTKTEPTDTESRPGATMSVDDMTSEQAQLHSEMVLFEPIAKSEASDGSGGGGSFAFRDDESDFGSGVIRPDGITLADEYDLTWSDGKVISYALRTDSGLRMEYAGGVISVDVAVDAPQHAELRDFGERLATAVTDWHEKHDEFPSLSSGMGTFTLQTSLFDEDEDQTVEIPKPDDVSMSEYVGGGNDFTVTYVSEKTDERARLTQDGLTFTEAVAIV